MEFSTGSKFYCCSHFTRVIESHLDILFKSTLIVRILCQKKLHLGKKTCCHTSASYSAIIYCTPPVEQSMDTSREPIDIGPNIEEITLDSFHLRKL